MDAGVAADQRERGESLLELIIAVAIMGIAAVAIVAALAASIIISDVHRKQAAAGSAVRSFAETIENSVNATATGYVACATTSAPGYLGYSAPSGYTRTITAISYWTGSSFSSSCSSDSGIQKVTLKVASNDLRASETLDVILRNPCRPTDAGCT